MKVILLDSPAWRLFYPEMHQHLGVCYLAGALRRDGFDVTIANPHMVTSRDKTTGQLTTYPDRMTPCDVLGISATTPQVSWASEIAQVWPAKVKVLGGAHATYVALGPHEQFKQKKYFAGFDYVMAGEGDNLLVEFCRRMSHQMSVRELSGLGYFEKDGNLISNPPKTVDVTQVADPAFDLWPALSSPQIVNINGTNVDLPLVGVDTARGCPYGCRFCGDARTGLREVGLGQTIRQALHLQQLGVKAVYVRDETFTIKPKRCTRIAEVLHAAGLGWQAMTRANLTDARVLRHFAENGCLELSLGVESGSAKMLRLMDKGTTPTMNLAATKGCKEAGIAVCALMMIGFPGETVGTLEESRRWLAEAQPTRASLSLFQPYPGCDVWNHPERYGVKLPDAPFEHWWGKGLEGTEDDVVLDLPTISRRDLARGHRELARWMDEHIASRDRTSSVTVV